MEKHRILAIDDESSITRMLKLILERALPVEVLPFSDAREALAWIESGEEKADLILCDLRMPYMNGLTFCQTLKSLGYSIPIIILSAYVTTEINNESKNLNVRAYIQKPFLSKDLIETLRAYLPAAQTPGKR